MRIACVSQIYSISSQEIHVSKDQGESNEGEDIEEFGAIRFKRMMQNCYDMIIAMYLFTS